MAMYPPLDDVLAAFDGRVPTQHPHVTILRAAWLLATLPGWMNPHSMTTLEAESGGEALIAVGLPHLTTTVREALTDRIAVAANDSDDLAEAIDRLAAIRNHIRRLSPHSPPEQITAAVQAFNDARKTYTDLTAVS
ncbi:glycosyltransferase [Nocardia sp. BMG51109]|uniref:glycosyltransferase n=1 Tax=Nocardia sp. BMG51109 TaxID=1056816 RepID=UPI0004679407|nr:hypothetical protein [Nocardia sp. BMG51109]